MFQVCTCGSRFYRCGNRFCGSDGSKVWIEHQALLSVPWYHACNLNIFVAPVFSAPAAAFSLPNWVSGSWSGPVGRIMIWTALQIPFLRVLLGHMITSSLPAKKAFLDASNRLKFCTWIPFNYLCS